MAGKRLLAHAGGGEPWGWGPRPRSSRCWALVPVHPGRSPVASARPATLPGAAPRVLPERAGFRVVSRTRPPGARPCPCGGGRLDDRFGPVDSHTDDRTASSRPPPPIPDPRGGPSGPRAASPAALLASSPRRSRTLSLQLGRAHGPGSRAPRGGLGPGGGWQTVCPGPRLPPSRPVRGPEPPPSAGRGLQTSHPAPTRPRGRLAGLEAEGVSNRTRGAAPHPVPRPQRGPGPWGARRPRPGSQPCGEALGRATCCRAGGARPSHQRVRAAPGAHLSGTRRAQVPAAPRFPA